MKIRKQAAIWGLMALVAVAPACSDSLEDIAQDIADEVPDETPDDVTDPVAGAGQWVVAENSDGSRLEIQHTIFFGNAAANAVDPAIQIQDDEEAAGLPALSEVTYATETTRANKFVNPKLTSVSYAAPNLLPGAGSPALDAANCPAPTFGEASATYCGAFKDVDWMAGWTTWDDDYAACNPGAAIDKTGTLATQTWTTGNTYRLNGAVSVPDGVTLTIQPGVYVVGVSSPVSWLQVQRGGKINAQGTSSSPIVFTSEQACGGTPERGDWGGVVILGKAQNNTSANAELEGNGGTYGGTDDNDGAGTVLKYVRIEYAGWELSADNELNGLTLGSVGRGADISYIHVHEGLDDGIEWFGGAGDYHHLVVSGTGDDCFDGDEGFRGIIQYAVCIQASSKGDNGLEISSNADNVDALPRTDMKFSNLTLVGNGAYQKGSGLKFKEGPSGVVHNSVVVNFKGAMDLDEYAVTIADTVAE